MFDHDPDYPKSVDSKRFKNPDVSAFAVFYYCDVLVKQEINVLAEKNRSTSLSC